MSSLITHMRYFHLTKAGATAIQLCDDQISILDLNATADIYAYHCHRIQNLAVYIAGDYVRIVIT